ncbi:MAG: hypothetical protein QOF80_1710 [Verrucomicrobiota bacterium]|jgi:hypothetical protein
MKIFSLLLCIILVASARAQSLRLILVPQQIEVSPAASGMKFDLFLYNAGDSAHTVPSLEEFRAFYTTYHHANSDSKSGTEIRAFNHPIKDHTLKAQRVDHTIIEIDLSSEDGDYIELRVAIGHDERTLTSNSVLLLCHPVSASPTEKPQSPKADVTPK